MIALLSQAHLVLEELVEGGEIDGVLLGAYRRQVSLGMDGEVRVVSLVGKEWVTPVVAFGALLYANSARGKRFDQLSCW